MLFFILGYLKYKRLSNFEKYALDIEPSTNQIFK
jgi:hypothetical protein